MPYNPAIPKANDIIKDSQKDILVDYMELNDWLAVDHYTFNDPNEGKHKQLTLPVQQEELPIGNNEGLIFCDTHLLFNDPLFITYIRQNNSSFTDFTSSQPERSGWSFLPSGLLLKWGIAEALGVDAVIYPTANNIPEFNTVLHTFTVILGINQQDRDGIIVISTVDYTVDGFEVWAGLRTQEGVATQVIFYYITIGT